MKITDYNKRNNKDISRFKKVFNNRHPEFLEPIIKQNRFAKITSQTGMVPEISKNHLGGWCCDNSYFRHPLENREDPEFDPYGDPVVEFNERGFPNPENNTIQTDLGFFRGRSLRNRRYSKAPIISEQRLIYVCPETLWDMLGPPTFDSPKETGDTEVYGRYVFYDYWRRGIYFRLSDNQPDIRTFVRQKDEVTGGGWENCQWETPAEFWGLNYQLPFSVTLDIDIGDQAISIRQARAYGEKIIACYLDLFLVWCVNRLRPYLRSANPTGSQQEFSMGGEELYLNQNYSHKSEELINGCHI